MTRPQQASRHLPEEVAQILAVGIRRLRQRHAQIPGEPVGLAIVPGQSVHGPAYPRPQEHA